MRATRLLPVLLLAACVDQLDLADQTQLIVGGTQAASADHPTVVGLLSSGNNWFCTGVLVDKDWVMTSASCFEGRSTAQVRLDDSTLGDSGGRTVAVTEIRKHPGFDINSTTWNHDVALLHLAESVTDRTPSKIRREALPIASQVTQVGFGVRDNNNNGGGQLRTLATTSIDCARANDSGISGFNLLCFDASDGTGSCNGDGGAPAFAGTAIAGLASGGTGSSCTRGIDVYTAVSAELEFLDSVLPKAAPPPTDDPPNPDDPSDDPVDPDNDDDTRSRPRTVSGCSTGGGNAGWLALGLGLLLRRRRR